jgi:Protein of unknown function (DUF4038)/Putative collagen-binding domain of a collagenase
MKSTDNIIFSLLITIVTTATLCAGSPPPGPLRVSRDGRHLVQPDGAAFFWLGDTPWGIVRIPPQDVDLYLADRAQKGFNVIQINASNWPEEGRQDYLGRKPFAGSGPPWTAVKFNEAYWSNVDDIVRKAGEHGIYVALTAMWGPNAGRPDRKLFADPSRQNYEYGLALGRRYRDAPHVLWIACGEYQMIAQPGHRQTLAPTELRLLRRIAEGLREGDGGCHLITFHPDGGRSSSEEWQGDPLVNFNMIQTYGVKVNSPAGRVGGWTYLVSRDYALTPPKPVINGEPAYEDRHLYRPKQGLVDDAHLRWEAYGSVFRGAFGFTYGHITIYHFGTKAQEGTDWKANLNDPGAAQMKHLRALMESQPLLDRVPDNSLITSRQGPDVTKDNDIVATRDRAAGWAFIYTSQGYGFRADLGRLPGPKVLARWFDPRTGQYRAIDTYAVPGQRDFDPPGTPGRGNDWVLTLEVVP